MNSTPCSASTAQNRSSGLCSRVASNLLDPKGRAPRAFSTAGALGRGHAHVRANQRHVHAIVVVLIGDAERLRPLRARHGPHFTGQRRGSRYVEYAENLTVCARAWPSVMTLTTAGLPEANARSTAGLMSCGFSTNSPCAPRSIASRS